MTNKEREVWTCRLYSPHQEEMYSLRMQLADGKLSLWEDAHALSRYLQLSGDTQSACAKMLGRSPSAVANRLRLLKLPEDTFRKLCDEGLSERHARALLRLSDADEQRKALTVFLKSHLTVAEAEKYIDERMASGSGPDAEETDTLQNRWLSALRELCRVGICSSVQIQDGPDALILMLRFPKENST